ncbi:putative negative regulator of RcsB-dependent stress response [Balneicella halophila]|uniref:Putative negative regulator of RcsB-dependent stress response n=1 Tax=Balneicella halophila TaxID=1537566 RepID=A0A7L4URA3_BALHA|nr:tetratricopeptide repeat protein [Balneicella halophila]PVX50839.1 putative negative regulator of RcsB-dependent stress response [Balneicella halophila]
MSKKKHQKKQSSEIEESFGNIEESLTKTEQFIESNQKTIIIVVLAIVAIVLAYFAYNKFYKAPKEDEALSNMYQAEEFFKAEEYQKALDGVSEVGNQAPGFLEVIDDYGSTKAGNLAHYYAGISYKNLGEYEKAIDYLDDFSSDDYLLKSIAVAAKADCHFELGNYDKAASTYEEASTINPNNFSTPIYLQRAGLAYEKLGKYDKAIEAYTELKEKYANSIEGRDADKYITRAKLAQGK